MIDEIAKKLNIKSYRDWKKVTPAQIKQIGGNDDANNEILFAILSELGWLMKVETKRSIPRFPKSYFHSTKNQKNFMDMVASKLQIKTPSDWGKVTVQQVHEHGGGSLVSNYYNSSLFTTLQTIYKGFVLTKKRLINRRGLED